ncbi:MAG: hypothetical protein L3J52_01015, partial [Proteobacteria bacterium]|nr:hypothetical protein [Pseudomonadota bacterium]
MFKTIKITLISLLILLAAWITPVVLKNPGFIQIELAGYQIEMSLLVAMGLGVVTFLMIWLAYALYKAPTKAIKNISANRSRKKFALGLLALSEGKWPTAEKLLIKSADKSLTPELSFMAAARAAVAQNKLEKAEEYLDQAEASTDNPLTVDLTRCEIWIKTNRAEKA